MHRWGVWRRRSVALAVAAGVAGVATGAVGMAAVGWPPARSVTAATFAALAGEALPAVATVYTTIPGQVKLTGKGATVTPAAKGIGSGVLVDRTGLVLTNDHVVSGASTVRVRLRGTGRTVAARIVGTDYALDLALLRIPAPRHVAPLALAPASQPPVGAWVQAIGNPEGLVSTVTVGVVSAHDRSFTIGGRHYKDLLQTDAAINPGNSGGPLLDLAGRVVGINTAVVANAYGLGFAIPAAAVRRALPGMERQHLRGTGWLGVDVTTLTPALRSQAGTAATSGALVLAVLPGSPAEAAGLKAGDVIQAVGGATVGNAQALVRLVSTRPPRSRVAIDVARGGATLELRGVLGQMPTASA
jgi:serine protease Do